MSYDVLPLTATSARIRPKKLANLSIVVYDDRGHRVNLCLCIELLLSLVSSVVASAAVVVALLLAGL